MAKPKIQEPPELSGKPFNKNVLRCVGENNKTAKEIWKIYLQKYPPSFLERRLGISTKLSTVSEALKLLRRLELVSREITRFLETGLEEDVVVYRLTDKGRSLLLSGKQK